MSKSIKDKTGFPTIENDKLAISINPLNGAVERCVLKNDPEQMNWFVEAQENPWHASGFSWGLGYLNLAPKHKPFAGLVRWELPRDIVIENNACRVVYEQALFTVEVSRCFHGDASYGEHYRVINAGNTDLEIYNLAIYTPFNDNYPDSLVCIKKRCNAHIWCGGELTWINALRMGGMPPHLGFVVTKGSFSGYEISERRLIGNASNVRGTIGLLADIKTISAGSSYEVEWRLFPHRGHEHFKTEAHRIASFPLPEADRYTVCKGEQIRIALSGADQVKGLKISADGKAIETAIGQDGKGIAVWTPSGPGQYRVDVEGNGKKTFLKMLAITNPMHLIEQRAKFIIEEQQISDPESKLDGAFLVYDNELQKTYCSKGDYNEGRERVGMGVMIAMLHRLAPKNEYVLPLQKYHQFIRTTLQKDDGTVLNGVDDEHCRPYNYPWVAWFHLEMYLTFGKQKYLVDAIDTLRAFYRIGHEFYAINIQVAKMLSVLQAAGLTGEHHELLGHFVRQGDFIIKRGLDYPSHEVIFEQSIIGPAVQFIYELYLATKSSIYLDAVAPHLRCLEMLGGRQPDFHLNEIAIRHWDGWWFGKRPRWGDTFPHYWSTITANAFHRCWQATGNLQYLARAKEIAMNNLCLFSEDGRGSCAYLYPILVDGEPGRYYDPYANDQDWALVHYLDIASDFENLL